MATTHETTLRGCTCSFGSNGTTRSTRRARSFGHERSRAHIEPRTRCVSEASTLGHVVEITVDEIHSLQSHDGSRLRSITHHDPHGHSLRREKLRCSQYR